MQFRFVEQNADSGKIKLLGFTKISDYAEAFKLFTFMKDNETNFCVMINTEDMVETEGAWYTVQDVAFVSPIAGGTTLPYFNVFLKEAC